MKDEYLGLPELPGRNTNICTGRLHISHHNRPAPIMQSWQMLIPLLTADYILTGKESPPGCTYLFKYLEPLSEMELYDLEEIMKNCLLACGLPLPG